jgi:uncharacterized protein YbcI
VLTVGEQQLVASLPAAKGRDLLKQVRIHLIETARPVMEAMVEKVTGSKVISLQVLPYRSPLRSTGTRRCPALWRRLW